MTVKKILLLLLLLPRLNAQEAPAPEKGAQELLPNQKEYLALPEARRIEFAKHMNEGMRLFQQTRILEALEKIDKAEKIFAKSAELLNLRGSCYMEMRAFDKAKDALDKALAISPDNGMVRFNKAEVFFVTKQWKEANDLFQEILKEIPEGNLTIGRFVEFKILLCKKKLGLKEEALALAGKYDFRDDSPYYYYAQAVLAYDAEKFTEAKEWIERAQRVFGDEKVIAPWIDTLTEYGYLDNFTTEDVPAGE